MTGEDSVEEGLGLQKEDVQNQQVNTISKDLNYWNMISVQDAMHECDTLINSLYKEFAVKAEDDRNQMQINQRLIDEEENILESPSINITLQNYLNSLEAMESECQT